MAEALSLNRIGQIAVRASDLDQAIAFYRDVLAMPFLFRVPNLAFFQCGEVRLMLGPAEQPEHDHPGSVIYYRVDDIQAAQEVWMAFSPDVSGNPLAIRSEPPIAGQAADRS